MGSHRIVVSGPATIDQVWARYTRPGLWPHWAPHIRSVQASAQQIEPGVTGVVNATALIRVSFCVLEVDSSRHTWAWRVHAGPVRLDLEHDLTASPDGVCAGLTIRGPYAVILPYAPLAAWALRRLTRRERPVVEAQVKGVAG